MVRPMTATSDDNERREAARQRADDLREYVKALEQIDEYQRFHKIETYKPYPKQEEFHALGLTMMIRALFAGNQDGKTFAGAAEMAYHLTGRYPKWWVGRVFNHPIEAWACGDGGLIVRDVVQGNLMGKPGIEEALGTGLIPREDIATRTRSHGVADSYDTVHVKHHTDSKEDGISSLSFKSYDQGREKFQSKTLDFFWEDEEPPMDIHTELLSRISATGGCGILTFTPIKGRGPLVSQILDEPSPDRASIIMTIHEGAKSGMTPEQRQKIINAWPKHEQMARAYGVPMMGEGAVWRIDPAAIAEKQIPMSMIPREWSKIWGIDFGIAHPFAAALLLHDRDADIIHIWHTIRVKDQAAREHVSAMQRVGADVPVAWPHDGAEREKGTGEELQLLYKTDPVSGEPRMKMLAEHATWPGGGNSVERGITEIEERAATGRLFISEHLVDLMTEWRGYHRKNGLIVKERDDLLSAMRYGIMMIRYAKTVTLGSKRSKSRGSWAPPEQELPWGA